MLLLHLALILLSVTPIVATFLVGYQTMRAGFALMGRPAIRPYLFYLAKAVIGLSFCCLSLAAIFPTSFSHYPLLIQNEIPDVQQLMCLIFLLSGNLLLLPAYYTMSIFTRVGLPVSEHVLQTEGVFHISRNPMYTSLIFFYTATFLLVPSLLLAALFILSLVLHHVIIKREEAYLEDHFGQVYLTYKNRVARYL